MAYFWNSTSHGPLKSEKIKQILKLNTWNLPISHICKGLYSSISFKNRVPMKRDFCPSWTWLYLNPTLDKLNTKFFQIFEFFQSLKLTAQWVSKIDLRRETFLLGVPSYIEILSSTHLSLNTLYNMFEVTKRWQFFFWWRSPE